MLNFIGCLIFAFVNLIKRYKSAIGIERVQLKYLLFGLIVTFTLIATTDLLGVVVFKSSYFVQFGPLYTLFLVGAVSYAIVKHRFLDIRFVVARTVAYSLLVFILGIFYALGLFLFGIYFFGIDTSSKHLAVSTILALILAFTFQPLLRFLEKLTDQVFFKEKYDPQILLGDMSHIMASTFALSELSASILTELFTKLKTSFGYLILLKEGSIAWVKSSGLKKHPEFDEMKINNLIQTVAINYKERIAVFEELSEESDEKHFMRGLNINIVLPLMVEGDTIGAIFLGEKSSGDIYSEEDINILKILAPEVSVAVKNALSYEEIKRFNITLQDEVEKATSDLKNANIKLQELDKLKDEFVSLASHELRTPMTAIKGSLSTILDGYAGEVSSQSKEFLTAAYNENDRLIRLVNNLLNISRIEAGRFTFNVIKVNLGKLISEVVVKLQSAAKEKNIFMKYESTGQLPFVYGDEDKVKEVIINLVGNASKFTHKGGITVKTNVKDSMVVTSVTDTGSGIAKEDVDRLFKKFSQVGENYARPTGGTGLGLYISKQIVEGLKGKIWLESTLGIGTTFYFSLPIAA